MSYRNKGPHRAEIVTRLIRENNYKDIAEIGVRDGETAMILAMTAGVNHYLAVDINRNTVLTEWIRRRKRKIFDYVIRPSLSASMDVKDKSLDLVFIDAAHDYESIAEDIKAWLPKVRDGGIICGHDYLPGEYDGVVKAVDENFEKVDVETDTVSAVWSIKI